MMHIGSAVPRPIHMFKDIRLLSEGKCHVVNFSLRGKTKPSLVFLEVEQTVPSLPRRTFTSCSGRTQTSVQIGTDFLSARDRGLAGVELDTWKTIRKCGRVGQTASPVAGPRGPLPLASAFV